MKNYHVIYTSSPKNLDGSNGFGIRTASEDIPKEYLQVVKSAVTANKFANDVAEKYLCPKISVDDGGRQLLMAYSWPGNVRQLLHLVEEISIVETERLITADILKRYLPDFESRMTSAGGSHKDSYETGFGPGEKAMLYKVLFEMKQQLEEVRTRLGLSDAPIPPTHPVRQLSQGVPIAVDDFEEQEAEEVGTSVPISTVSVPVSASAPTAPASTQPEPPVRTLEQMEKEAIEQALKRNGGNKRRAAEELGISERTIHRKIADYGL